MTKYVMHGGGKLPGPLRDQFFKLMSEHLQPGGIWLGCYFASEAEKWQTKFEADSQSLKMAEPEKEVVCECATVKDFTAQVAAADVVYFSGGRTWRLMEAVNAWPKLAEWLQKKVMVAGSSAGMNMLGREAHGQGGRITGLGLVPFSTVPHQGSAEYNEQHQKYPVPAPVLWVPENQFCIVEV